MKISLKWLQDYVDLAEFFAKPEELARLLTAAGLEVESITDQSKQFQHVVVGHILEKGVHPNADRLSLCQVSTGDGVVHQIVCGAQNHKSGDRVVVALPGAILPGDFAIKQAKVRGVESGGMLCSEKELGLSNEGDGIVILPADAPVGRSFAEYRGLNDVLFEIKVTPNRADCLSHRGLALEVGCLLGREVRAPKVELRRAVGAAGDVSVEIQAADLGPRYAGRLVRGVKVGPSPDWLRQRLENVGLNSINNVVDITNYVMMELGQPMHAFDTRELRGRGLIVARAVAGESFVTLDGTELKLDGTELTIRDRERAVALAGVVGGKNSGVSESTTEIFLESAYFRPSAVRRTLRKFGFETDSGYRFSRGVNPEGVRLALDRATALVVEIAGGEAATEAVDVYPSPLERAEIRVNLKWMEERLGYAVEASDFESWMKRLGAEFRVLTPGDYLVIAPSHRPDLLIDADLLEEFARLQGYDRIPEKLPRLDTAPAAHDADYLGERRARRVLAGLGVLQALNYAFIGDRAQKEFVGEALRWRDVGLHMDDEDVRILNPLNEEINVMRRALSPGLYRNALHNFRNGERVGRLFEIGKSFHRRTRARNEKFAGTEFGEESRLAFSYWGGETDLWGRKEAAPPAMRLKSDVEAFLHALGVSGWSWRKLDSLPAIAHPGQAAGLVLRGHLVGFIASVHPLRLEEDKFRAPVAMGELALASILEASGLRRFQIFSAFPLVDRDVALVMARDVSAGAVAESFQRAAKRLASEGGEWLRSVEIFDVFEGAALGEGKKSVAYRLMFQSLESSLDDARVNALRDKIVQDVCSAHDVAVR